MLNATVHVHQHGEEVLQRDFPADMFSLTYLCPMAWSSYVIDIITSTVTISLGSLAHWTVSQERCSARQHTFSCLFSSSLFQMPETYCSTATGT